MAADGDDPGAVSSDVRDHEELIRQAEAEASKGQYKDAYNLLGQGPWRGGPEDQEFRYRRGLYAYNVAHQRLDGFRDSRTPKLTLIKAGCWLSRSEAYLLSAAEDAEDEVRDKVEDEVQRTKREQERFRQLCQEFGEDLFVCPNDELNED